MHRTFPIYACDPPCGHQHSTVEAATNCAAGVVRRLGHKVDVVVVEKDGTRKHVLTVEPERATS